MNKIVAIVKRFSSQAISAIKPISIFDASIILTGIVLAILIRYPLLSFFSHDYYYKISHMDQRHQAWRILGIQR